MLTNSFLDLAVKGNADEVDVRQEEKVVDVLVIQEAAEEATKQGAGSNHALDDAGDIYEMFSELETEVGPEIEIRVIRWAMPYVVESSEFKERPQVRLTLPIPRATPTKNRTRSQTS
ncbi:hypothetical protein D8674_035251 [Pyrus ussuriensis x Pyrus communis]|uniref:Uncharacterized protein n=1 Tax=Pyrus ussuriensis x Pyrus communis TaxID=2448454 RepID=A0A5N5GBU1_9ROSA|nr:hypothetical protein D8674_035251 [Pyrus ussuriensis x Pyrus communis]